MKRPSFLAAVLLVLGLANLGAAATRVEFERWYQILLGDEPAGWMHATTTREGEQFDSGCDMQIAIRRGAVALEIQVTSHFSETAEGKPLRATLRQKLGAIAIDQEMTFAPESIEMVTRQAGQEQRQTLPLAPADRSWLPPAAAQRYAAGQLAAGAKEIRYRSLDPSAGPKPFETCFTITGREKIEVMGKVVPAVVGNQTMSIMPNLIAKAYLDESGQPLKSTITMIPGMEMVIVEADEQLAKALVNPPELLASTFVKPDKPIADPRHLSLAIYELKLADAARDHTPGTSGIPAPQREKSADALFPRCGVQRVIWGDERTIRVALDLAEPVNPVDDLPTADHRRATGMLNCEDPQVRELLAKALPDTAADWPAARKAEALRRFVHRFIHSKDLSVGYASASEVARTGEGDCTEHAVLLAALLRGAGIPSRTVTGLLYVDHFMDHEGIFGYHMWTQAWLSAKSPADRKDPAPVAVETGRWLDLDATLDDQTPFDAAHIALATSAMVDGQLINDMVKMVPLIGRLSIRVIDLGNAGGVSGGPELPVGFPRK